MGQMIPTPLDFDFEIFRFRVHINGLFWLVTLLFGWESARGMDAMLGPESPGRALLVLLWITVVFASILLHELGHAFAFRRYGIQAMIALHHFGGFAMPVSSSYWRTSWDLDPKEDFVISAAGPAAQLILAALLGALTVTMGYHIPGFEWLTANRELSLIPNAAAYCGLYFLMFVNVWWAVLNLAPVWPMDGGRIGESIDRLYFRTTQHAMTLSLIVAIFLAYLGLSSQNHFMGLFFLSLALTSFQRLQTGGSSW